MSNKTPVFFPSFLALAATFFIILLAFASWPYYPLLIACAIVCGIGAYKEIYGQKPDDEEFLRDFLATQEAIVEAPIDYSMNPNALEESLAQIYALSSYAIENYSTSMTDNVYATLDHINGISRRCIRAKNPEPNEETETRHVEATPLDPEDWGP